MGRNWGGLGGSAAVLHVLLPCRPVKIVPKLSIRGWFCFAFIFSVLSFRVTALVEKMLGYRESLSRGACFRANSDFAIDSCDLTHAEGSFLGGHLF